MSKLKIITGVMFLLFLVSCTKAIIDETEPTTPITETITYDANVQTIIFNNCVTCHSGAAPSAGLDLTTYQNVRSSAENGNLLVRMEDVGNPMPPAGLVSADLRAQIKKWAEDGFPEN